MAELTEKKSPPVSVKHYRLSFFVAAELLIIGLFVEAIYPFQLIGLPIWPLNILILLVFITFLVLLFVFYRKSLVFRWLSGIPSAISAIVLLTLLALLLGFIPQGSNNHSFFYTVLGFTRMKTSWPFILALIYLLTTLGLTTIKRIFPITLRNAGFFFNHAGLWFAIVGGMVGSGDLIRYQVNLQEKEAATNKAYDLNGHQHRLPFFLSLNDFTIEEYNPGIILFNIKTEQEISPSEKVELIADTNIIQSLGPFKIASLKYIPLAERDSDGFIASHDSGVCSALYAKVVNTVNTDTIYGWLAYGSSIQYLKPLQLNDSMVLLLSASHPKKYSSLIEVSSGKEFFQTSMVEVNKPFSFHGWKLYQLGYDEEKGKWSKLSILEAVHDPWLPMVYLGIFMMMAGSVYLFFFGRKIHNLTKE